MAFCSKCGKEIAEGQVCSCQAPKFTKEDAKALANGTLSTAIDVVADPVGGTRRFVNNASWLLMGVIVALDAIFTIIFNIIGKIKTEIKHDKDIEKWADKADMKVKEYLKTFDVDANVYEFKDYLVDSFKILLFTVVATAVLAAVSYFIVKFVGKQVITWQQACALAVIACIILIPVEIVTGIFGFLPSWKILAWIVSAISVMGSVSATVVRYLAYNSVVTDVKKCVYTFVAIVGANSIVYAFVHFLINELF